MSARSDPTSAAKRCPRCDKVRSRSEFYVNPARGDGLDSYCIQCRSELTKGIYDSFTPQEKQRRQEYHAVWRARKREESGAPAREKAPIQKIFSLTDRHAQYLEELAARLGKTESIILREAIDDLHTQMTNSQCSLESAKASVPAREQAPIKKSVRLSERQVQQLNELAALYHESEAGVIRRAIVNTYSKSSASPPVATDLIKKP